jgi:hypothetical protein
MQSRHSGLDPESLLIKNLWIPAFAGMTNGLAFIKKNPRPNEI